MERAADARIEPGNLINVLLDRCGRGVYHHRMVKDFTEWHGVKTTLDAKDKAQLFHERDVWWCSVGVNVGHEIDGKGKYATRPVLVVRKFNRRIFLGVPLTTQIKQNPYYHRIHFLGREQCVMLSQLRLWEGKRMRNRMGQFRKISLTK